MGFVWKHYRKAIDSFYLLSMTTIRRTEFDEELRAEYLMGVLAGRPVPCFREPLGTDRECVMFTALLSPGEIFCIWKNDRRGLFVLLYEDEEKDLDLLGEDLGEEVDRYTTGEISLEALLSVAR